MRAIVTGGSGFIGYNLVKALLNDDSSNWGVLVIDNLSSGKSWNKHDGAEYIIAPLESGEGGDLSYIEHSVLNFKPDVIFHLAAVPRVSFSIEYPYETTESNVMSTISVLDAARKYGKPGIRVIYSSSSSIYGGADTLPTSPDCPSNPQSPYAMQKWQGEEWCKLYSKAYGLETICLRYFNVTGPHSYFGGAYSTVLSAWLYHLYIDSSYVPFLEGDGLQSRDFCAVENVCQANILAALSQHNVFKGESFNVAQGSSHTLLECKEILEKISGKKLTLECRPDRAGDVKHTLADITLTESILGYNPSVDFEAQVRKMAKWYENNYRLQ